MVRTSPPSVTVVVLNYNYGRFLGSCLASLDAQDTDDLAVLVIDDASTDESAEVIDGWSATTRLPHEIIRKPTNLGAADSYNQAISRVTSTYVKFLDADDELPADAIRLQREFFDTLPVDVAVVFSDSVERVDGSERARPSHPPDADVSALQHLFQRGAFFALNAGLIRTSCLKTIPPMDTAIRLCDYPMWVKLARTGRFVYFPGVMSIVRVHPMGASRTDNFVADRLLIAARSAYDARERHWVRTRGRSQLHVAATAATRPPLTAIAEYGLKARDWQAIPLGVASQVPVLRRTLRRRVHAVRSGE